jgi:hypothetical protein
MSVSSHLTPEPERRLWLILEGMQAAAARADRTLAALAALALAECAVLRGGPAWAVGPLLAVLVAAVFGLSPLSRAVKWMPWLEPPRTKFGVDDSLVSAADLAKYPVGEMINRLDRYLGGGITATQYYEDIVREISVTARAAARKQRVVSVVCLAALLAQLAFAAALLAR